MQAKIDRVTHRERHGRRRARVSGARPVAAGVAACLVSAVVIVASLQNATAQTTQLRDVAVTDAVEEALASNPEVYALNIGVSTYDGIVTLWGTVYSHRERQLIEDTATRVSGVRAVDSRIAVSTRVTVQSLTRARDAEIRRDVEEALASNWQVDSRRIGVSVYRGEVTLSGMVNSEDGRTMAIMLAMVPGAQRVHAEYLRVVDWAAYGRGRTVIVDPPVYVYPSDSQIEHTIRQAFELSADVPHGRVGVESRNGRVALYGTVESRASRSTAQQIAMRTVGVASVINRIQVRPTQPVTDAAIESRIAAGLARDEYLSPYPVGVSVHEGVATLWGDVHTAFERRQAAEVASEVPGVRRVINRIAVEVG